MRSSAPQVWKAVRRKRGGGRERGEKERQGEALIASHSLCFYFIFFASSPHMGHL